MPRSPRLMLSLGLLGAVLCAGSALAGAWPDPETLDAALETALAGKQTTIEPVETRAMAPTLIQVDPGPLAAFLKLLTFLLVAAGVVLLVTQLVQRFGGARAASASADATEPADDAAELAPTADQVPDEAVRAAARGDFGEALRLLLGEVLPRFYRGQGRGWPEAWTSRQCLRRVARQDPARDELAGLIGAVERHHFGGLPAGEADWRHWRQQAGQLQPAPPPEPAT